MTVPNIKIICVGTLKEQYWRSAVEGYRRSIRKWARMDIIEVNSEKVPGEPNPTLEKMAKDREANALLKRVGGADYVVTLEIEGSPLTSMAFRQLLHSKKDLVFLIGGTLGLGEPAIKRRDSALSFSGLTFPHQLMRVLLLEQICRANGCGGSWLN